MIIFIIGLGGAGKSTSGKILAKMLNFDFIDLDEKFCKNIGDIAGYINKEGYKNYCFINSSLFYNLIKKQKRNCVFVLSSGFLIHKELTKKHQKSLKELGISILLLPSKKIEESLEIIVKRQLSRNLNLNEKRETEKFLERFYQYQKFGDIKIFSKDNPERIAKKMKEEILKKYNNINSKFLNKRVNL